MRKSVINSFLICAALLAPSMLFGQDVETKPLPAADTTASDDLENILDHLEKKMTDRENLETPDDKQVPQKKGLAGPRKASDLKPQNEKADRKTVKQQQTMKAIQSKINEYDNRIEILESDLRRLRANVYDASVTDNLVAIEIRPSDTSKFLIRDLRANLDGNTLYNRQDPSGLWVPSKSIMLFHGPLRPGDHQVDISATLVPLSPDGMKLPTSEHRNLDQTFKFAVAEGKQRRQLILEISSSTDDNPKPLARLIEGEAR